MGNNEMVGPFGAATVFGPQAPPLGLVRLSLALQETRLGQLLMDASRRLRGATRDSAAWQGMEMFLKNEVPPKDPRRDVVYDSFRKNLNDILQAGVGCGASVILSTVAVNLKDCPPFGSLSGTNLPAADRASWEKLCADGAAAEKEALFGGLLSESSIFAPGELLDTPGEGSAGAEDAARELADVMIKHFADPAGGFFDTSDDHETLVTRPKDLQDNATPSGNALAATVLLNLHLYTMEDLYYKQAELMLGLLQPAMIKAPTGFAQWLCALDFALSKPFEIAIVGDVRSSDTQALLDVARQDYRSNQVVAVGAPDRSSVVPLLLDRPQINHQATAYVCQNFACQRPTIDPKILIEQLS